MNKELKEKTSRKWEGIKGVKYPDDPPAPNLEDFISSREAARLMGVSKEAARGFLRVNLSSVRTRVNGVIAALWPRKETLELIQNRPPVLSPDEKLVPLTDAIIILGTTRSTLLRWLKLEGLTTTIRRLPVSAGIQKRAFLTQADIEKLKKRRG